MLIYLSIAFFLYAIAPTDYSYSFCFIVQLLFFANAVCLYMYDRSKESIGFNVIFSISFYCMFFLYPLFVYPIAPDFSFFSHGFNTQVINKCVALAFFAYACYSVGYFYSSQIEKKRTDAFYVKDILNPRIINVLVILSFFFFCVFVCSGGLSYFSNQYRGDTSDASPITAYSYLFVQVFVVLLMLTFLLEGHSMQKKVVIAILICVVLLLLMVGTRTLPLSILIIAFYMLNIKYKFSTAKIFVFGLVGMALMIVIGAIRHAGVGNASSDDLMGGGEGNLGFLGFFVDVIVISYNYYVLYDYTCMNSILAGLNLVSPILAIVPFSQSVFVSAFDVPPYMLDSPNFATFLVLGEGSTVGLGSNIVGDAYLAFGLFGVVIMFGVLGYVVAYFRNRFLTGELWGTIIYLQLVGGAFYMVRASMIGGFREYIWSIVIFNIITRCLLKNKMSDISNIESR